MARSLDRAILYESGVSTGPQKGHAEPIEARDENKKIIKHLLRKTVSGSMHMIDNMTVFKPIIEQILR
jgi:hypothetical protein